mmetsp:Transcript_86551/g.209892  ORF Transcript_86551/g.209892 Transcript_86551/m.209892 type:complete len:366 (+) Transcript_86551:284-1381(+)
MWCPWWAVLASISSVNCANFASILCSMRWSCSTWLTTASNLSAKLAGMPEPACGAAAADAAMAWSTSVRRRQTSSMRSSIWLCARPSASSSSASSAAKSFISPPVSAGAEAKRTCRDCKSACKRCISTVLTLCASIACCLTASICMVTSLALLFASSTSTLSPLTCRRLSWSPPPSANTSTCCRRPSTSLRALAAVCWPERAASVTLLNSSFSPPCSWEASAERFSSTISCPCSLAACSDSVFTKVSSRLSASNASVTAGCTAAASLRPACASASCRPRSPSSPSAPDTARWVSWERSVRRLSSSDTGRMCSRQAVSDADLQASISCLSSSRRASCWRFPTTILVVSPSEAWTLALMLARSSLRP